MYRNLSSLYIFAIQINAQTMTTTAQPQAQQIEAKMKKILKLQKKACPALFDTLQKEYMVLSVELAKLTTK